MTVIHLKRLGNKISFEDEMLLFRLVSIRLLSAMEVMIFARSLEA